ncbi:MAG: 2-phosphosulfolactate phosphatase [Planctomycetales bacterium]|nr:2-phosphosulfolactate phosphatase [Planctomycetales bacterium]
MGRSVSVSLLPSLIEKSTDFSQTCSIVIDVLRATSVMTAAGKSGVNRMVTCGDIDRARALADAANATDGSRLNRPLLCGERHCKPIDGFDLGNSPAEYTRDVVEGRDMILTTTNGTRAIQSVIQSRRLLVSSFLNLDATVTAVDRETIVHVVCAGTNGEISLEDVLLAGAIVDRLFHSIEIDRIDDSARIARHSWQQVQSGKRPLVELLRQSLGGRNLIDVGFAEDIVRCSRINTINGIVERVHLGESVFEYRTT